LNHRDEYLGRRSFQSTVVRTNRHTHTHSRADKAINKVVGKNHFLCTVYGKVKREETSFRATCNGSIVKMKIVRKII